MSKRDWLNIVLVFFDINSFVAGIQQHFTEKASKIFGLIEIGIYESTIIFLSITAFLLIYNKEWTEKHLDELTGRAKRKEKEAKEEQKLEKEERKEKEKLDELLSLIRESIKFLVLKVEDRNAVSRLSTATHYNQISLKTKLKLIELGFLVPNEEEKAHKDFDSAWYAFLSILEVVIEEGDYRMHLNLWEQARKATKFSKNP